MHRYLAFSLLVAAILGGTFAIKYARLSGRPERFAEVEPAQLYRSAHPNAESLKFVIQHYRVNTILALENEPGGHTGQAEEETARREGVTVVRIPVPDSPEGFMHALDKAADVIADPVNRPLLVYCASGVEQTGAAFVAYRLKYGNWTFEKAILEGEGCGCGLRDRPELVNILRNYDREHVLPAKASTSASAPAGPKPSGR